MGYVAKNGAKSTLAGALTAGATSLTVQVGYGDRYPVLGSGNWTIITLQDAAGNIERIKAETRASGADTISTLTRGYDGTTARSWSAGDVVEVRPNAPLLAQAVNDRAEHEAAANPHALYVLWSAISTFVQTLLNDDDAAAARTTLGAAATDHNHAGVYEPANANLADLGDIQAQTGKAYTTAGTSTAYTLTPTPAISALATDQEWDVTFHAAAGAPPTLSVSGLTPKSLKYRGAAGVKQAITSSQVPSGWRSKVVFDGTDYVVREIVMVGATKFTSPDQPITSAGLLTIGHGLGAEPFGIYVDLVCQVAEGGWSPGDVMRFPSTNYKEAHVGSNGGAAVRSDATNVYVRFGSSTGACFAGVNKTSGDGFLMTNANWKLRVRAWL